MSNVEVAKTREEIISGALEARVQEVMHYQINIDNYTLALQEISLLPAHEQFELTAFVEQLTSLLASEKIEQKKAKIMLSVMQKQVE
jgi:hypothetical protein